MRLLFLFFGLIILLTGFNYFSVNPKTSFASLLSASPAELTQDGLDDKSLLATSIQAPSIPTSADFEWPFTDTLVPSSIHEKGVPENVSSSDNSDYCLHVPIILYHHIQPLSEAAKLGHAQLTVDSGIFQSQMEYLASSGYTALSAEQLVQALLNHEELPEKSIVITIDDGYIDNYAYAFLIAKKYKLIINFMIPAGLIGKPGYMTWDHLLEMRDNEFAKIYNHTDSHAPLGLISAEQIEKELKQSTESFEANLGMNINIFTYPYGSFSPLAIEKLKEHGFAAAFTTNPGRRQCASEIMTLHRDHVGNAPLSLYDL